MVLIWHLGALCDGNQLSIGSIHATTNCCDYHLRDYFQHPTSLGATSSIGMMIITVNSTISMNNIQQLEGLLPQH